jgi:hypothetical protein
MAGIGAGASMPPMGSANAENQIDGFSTFLTRIGQVTDVVGNAIGNIAPIFANNPRPGQGNNPTYVGPSSTPNTANVGAGGAIGPYMPLLIIAALGVGAYFVFRKA